LKTEDASGDAKVQPELSPTLTQSVTLVFPGFHDELTGMGAEILISLAARAKPGTMHEIAQAIDSVFIEISVPLQGQALINS
jgi:hypothetical protein